MCFAASGAQLERRQRRLVASDYAGVLLHAGGADDRRRAALALGDLYDEASTGALRQAWLLDPSDDVKEAAAIALGRRGDPEAIESFIQALAERTQDRAAALGLGQAGDLRGARALVDALADGWRPALATECLRACGEVARPALQDAVAKTPTLARRKTFKELLS